MSSTETVLEEGAYKYNCTDCGGDATVGLSDFRGVKEGIIIKKNERLCLTCARKRNVKFF